MKTITKYEDNIKVVKYILDLYLEEEYEKLVMLEQSYNDDWLIDIDYHSDRIVRELSELIEYGSFRELDSLTSVETMEVVNYVNNYLKKEIIELNFKSL